MTAVALGLLGGLATIAVSEFLLKFWGSGSAASVFRILVTGIVLRAVWIFGLLAAVAVTGALDPKPFVLSLLVGYLVAQVLEGLRYQRLIRTR
jgi:hypothetical protein